MPTSSDENEQKQAIQLSFACVGLTQAQPESGDADAAAMRQQLIGYLNKLVNTDFNQLLSVLYRVDVSEDKLRKVLAEANGAAMSADIIADFIIERQQEKLRFRKAYASKQ